MAIPQVPNIKNAAWHHPYKFSGRIPFKSLLMMIFFGLLTALIAGAIGYYGGAASRWLQIQITHLGTAVAKWLVGWGAIGSGVAFVVVILPTIIAGILYPLIIGSIAGGGVATGAQLGKCRAPWLASLLGFLAGGAAYAVFVGIALLKNTPLHESSRVLEMIDPPSSYGLMVIDALIVLFGAIKTARVTYENPFCEVCGEWFSSPKTLTIPIKGAAPLVEALSSQSTLPLQGIAIGTNNSNRIQLNLSRCACGQSDYNLTAVLFWDEAKKDKVESKTKAWFNTILPASFGAEFERWSTTTQIPVVKSQAQSTAVSASDPKIKEQASQPKSQKVSPVHNVDQEPAKPPKPAEPAKQAPSQTSAKPTEQAPNICKRCGGTIDTTEKSPFTCPHCGHTQWGPLISNVIISLVLFGIAFLWGPHISASFWRAIIMWGGGILGGLLLIGSSGWIFQGLRTPLKPLSDVTLTVAPPSTLEIASEQGTTQSTETTVSVESKPDEVVPLPVQEEPAKKPVEIDWLVISNTCRKENYEEMARILYTLDKRSDGEYSSDKDAYKKTCDLIKEVGKTLNRKGGEDLMKQVLSRAGSLGSNTRFIEGEWNGIGTWLG